jgi:predicted nucleic acid-binding protein
VNRLTNLPTKAHVFVDTNIFALYYIDQGLLGQACRDFLLRTTRRQVSGYTSVAVVAEAIHRVMVAEAAAQLSLSSQKTVEHLQKHPELIQKLTRHLTVASDIHRLGIDILPITYKELHGSKNIRANFGLMTNDSLIVAVMRSHKLYHLATHDAGFARVTDLQVWRPIL